MNEHKNNFKTDVIKLKFSFFGGSFFMNWDEEKHFSFECMHYDEIAVLIK